MHSRVFPFSIVRSAGSLALACLAMLAKLIAGDDRNVYRPERHYMRGPGPKWREKNTPPVR